VAYCRCCRKTSEHFLEWLHPGIYFQTLVSKSSKAYTLRRLCPETQHKQCIKAAGVSAAHTSLYLQHFAIHPSMRRANSKTPCDAACRLRRRRSTRACCSAAAFCALCSGVSGKAHAFHSVLLVRMAAACLWKRAADSCAAALLRGCTVGGASRRLSGCDADDAANKGNSLRVSASREIAMTTKLTCMGAGGKPTL
jgi:hypothetical protein